jgi:hypothetical protein
MPTAEENAFKQELVTSMSSLYLYEVGNLPKHPMGIKFF